MAFTVEDGTAKIDSNSLAAVADADTYHADRSNTGWAALQTAEKQSLLIKATDYLMNAALFPWKGTAKTATQALCWPRTGVVETSGLAIADNIVPLKVKQATADLAWIAKTVSLQPVQTATPSRLRRKQVDVLETEYFRDSNTSDMATQVAQVTSALGLLRPLLRVSSGMDLGAVPYAKLPPREAPTQAPRPLFYVGQDDA